MFTRQFGREDDARVPLPVGVAVDGWKGWTYPDGHPELVADLEEGPTRSGDVGGQIASLREPEKMPELDWGGEVRAEWDV